MGKVHVQRLEGLYMRVLDPRVTDDEVYVEQSSFNSHRAARKRSSPDTFPQLRKCQAWH